jgi:hypothetical protein
MSKIVAADCVREGRWFDFWRADTGEKIEWVRWADPDERTVCVFWINPDHARANNIPVDMATKVLRGVPLRFTETRIPRKVAGKPEEIPEELRRRMVSYERVVAERGKGCMARGCYKLASYRVSDLQEIQGATNAEGFAVPRYITTGIRLYCAAHYLAPRLVSVRDVVSEIPALVGRPQWGR